MEVLHSRRERAKGTRDILMSQPIYTQTQIINTVKRLIKEAPTERAWARVLRFSQQNKICQPDSIKVEGGKVFFLWTYPVGQRLVVAFSDQENYYAIERFKKEETIKIKRITDAMPIHIEKELKNLAKVRGVE